MNIITCDVVDMISVTEPFEDWKFQLTGATIYDDNLHCGRNEEICKECGTEDCGRECEVGKLICQLFGKEEQINLDKAINKALSMLENMQIILDALNKMKEEGFENNL